MSSGHPIVRLLSRARPYLHELRNRSRARRPPSPDWKRERQTTPPTFGWAKRVSHRTLERAVGRRRAICAGIIRDSARYCRFTPGSVSLVVLSCRRWGALERLIDSMRPLGAGAGHEPLVERVLVDNGSGDTLVQQATAKGFFDRIIAHPRNLGMVGALRHAFRRVEGEYVLLVEDDFVLDATPPFLADCLSVFDEFPEIGLIRLKNQNNWWKPHRVIGPPRETRGGVAFWTWLPSVNGMLNVWCAGSVLFRKASYFHTGELPEAPENPTRDQVLHQGYVYECVYGQAYNRTWLAAKLRDHCPFWQPNDNEASRGWGPA